MAIQKIFFLYANVNLIVFYTKSSIWRHSAAPSILLGNIFVSLSRELEHCLTDVSCAQYVCAIVRLTCP